MSKSSTAALKGSTTWILLAVAAGFFLWSPPATAQQTLAEVVQQTGCEWMIGRWIGQGQDGQKYEIEYKWALNDHVISTHFKGFDFEYHGIVFYDRAEEQVLQIGVHSGGEHGKGTWSAEYGKSTMRYEQKGNYGEVSRLAFVYTRIDERTMKTEVYEMDSNGLLAAKPDITLQYKRQETTAGATTTTQR